MKAGRALIGIIQKMRIKNLRESVRSDLKSSTPSPGKLRKTPSFATFFATGV